MVLIYLISDHSQNSSLYQNMTGINPLNSEISEFKHDIQNFQLKEIQCISLFLSEYLESQPKYQCIIEA